MKLIGDDFRAAKSRWLYDASHAQPLLVAFLLGLLLLVLHLLLQPLFQVIVMHALGTDTSALMAKDSAAQKIAARAAVIALFPEGLTIAVIAFLVARLRGRSGRDVLSLRFPKLGLAGWLAIIAGFVFFAWLINFGLLNLLHIDPANYQPTAKGLDDTQNSSGLVEKTIADMADEPLMFWTALPAVIIGAPLAEEILFRGALFGAIINSGLGRTAAVVISAAAWAALHLFAAPLLVAGVLFGMGILLGIILLRFGSLWVTIACHCVWNALTMFAILGIVSN